MRKKTTIFIIAIVTLTVIAGVMYCCFRGDRNRHINISSSQFPIKGIDISAHNGIVDFNTLVKEGFTFAIIKATEGATFKDPTFHTNYNKARKSNLKIGVYHFFKFGTDGMLQGINLINSIKGKQIDLPIAIDIEEWSNDNNLPTEHILYQLSTLINYLEQNNIPIMLYSNKDGYNRFIKNKFDNYPLWICSFTDPPINSRWTLWQHSHRGKIKGLKGHFDFNTFNGTMGQWNKWLLEVKHDIQ